MVGSAIVRKLAARGVQEVLVRSRRELDLTEQEDVRRFFEEQKPECVILAAAKVGGIKANSTFPAEFLYENLMIESNIVHQAWKTGVRRLLFLGSSCIYPRDAQQPMQESALLSGTLESTNEPYAIAKIAGIKLCESYNRQHGTDFRSIMPTNLYGPHDNFSLEQSHVLPALIRKFHDAKIKGSSSVSVWGTGKALREFLHVDDMAEACMHMVSLPKSSLEAVTTNMMSHINVGYGEEISIAALVEIVAATVGYEGTVNYDSSKPDGTPRKLLDSRKIRKLGWNPEIALRTGIEDTYRWFLDNVKDARM